MLLSIVQQIAAIFEVIQLLLDRGANPNAASDGVLTDEFEIWSSTRETLFGPDNVILI